MLTGKFVRGKFVTLALMLKKKKKWSEFGCLSQDQQGKTKNELWHNDICPFFLETDFFTVSKTSKNNSYKNHSSFPMPFTLHRHSEKESCYCISKLWYLRTNKEKRWIGWKVEREKRKKKERMKLQNNYNEAE